MKILIFGNGQFARLFKEYFGKKGTEVVIAESADIRNEEQVRKAILGNNPDVVINTAAQTNLDWCEQNRLECFDTNVLGAECVGRVCAELSKYFLHISTGCIQESLTPDQAHKEEDRPTPTSFYSWTKYWADEMLQSLVVRKGLKLLILRPRQPVSGTASNRNALLKMLTFSKFIDTPNSITILEDFIEVTDKMITKGATGIYNVANPGVVSPLVIARLLKEYIKPDMVINEISKEELNKMTLATRIDSVLDCSKLEAEGIHLKPAVDRLREILPVLKADLEKHPEALEQTNQETIAKLSLRNPG